MNKYRIKAYPYYYIAQFRPWWWPFYMNCFDDSSSFTLKEAYDEIELHKDRIIKVK